MNGVVVLCSRTGSLLYGQSYATNFGLPESHRPVDELNLAAMLFALHINSRAVVIASAEQEGCDGGGLQMYEVGHTTMHFSHNEQAHVLGVVFIETATGEEIGRYLAERVVECFVEKYFLEDGPGDADGATGTPFKQLRPKASKSLLRGIFQELPGRIFELLLSRLDESRRPHWIFAVMSESFIAEIDWDDFLAAERSADVNTQLDASGNVEAIASPFGTPRQQVARGGAVGMLNGGIGLDPLATPVSTPFQTPRTGGASTQRKKHIPKVGYRTPKRRWWNTAAKPEQFASLGPLQHLYRDGEAQSATKVLEPCPAMLRSLVGLVKKAGKVMSSVGDVNDRLQSLEIRLRQREPAAPASSSQGSGSNDASRSQLTVTVLRASDDFLVALPSSAFCGGAIMLKLVYEDLLRLRIWMRFLHTQKIELPKVVE